MKNTSRNSTWKYVWMQWTLFRIEANNVEKSSRSNTTETYRVTAWDVLPLKLVSITGWSLWYNALWYTSSNWSVTSLQKSINVAPTLWLLSTVGLIYNNNSHMMIIISVAGWNSSNTELKNAFISLNSSWCLFTTNVTYHKQIISSRSTTCSSSFIHL